MTLQKKKFNSKNRGLHQHAMSVTPPLELEVVYDLRCSSQQATSQQSAVCWGYPTLEDAEENVT
jgi:hypothetical protein